MVMIVYNEAIDTEVMEVLQSCAIMNYSKIIGTFGKGDSSGAHLGNDIWPGRNNMLYIACDEIQSKKILSCIRDLRKTIGQEGIKAFMLPLEDLT